MTQKQVLNIALCISMAFGPMAGAESPVGLLNSKSGSQSLNSGAKTGSLNSAEQAILAVENYLNTTRELLKQVDELQNKMADAKDKDAIGQELQALALKKQGLDQRLLGICAGIATLPNGHTAVVHHLMSVFGVSRLLAQQDSEFYNFVLSHLFANYLEHPEDRDSIFQLLVQLSSDVKPIIEQEVKSMPELVIEGSVLAMTVISLARYRGGPKGLARDSRYLWLGARKGLTWLVNTIRQRPAAAEQAGELAAQTAREGGTALLRTVGQELTLSLDAERVASQEASSQGKSFAERFKSKIKDFYAKLVPAFAKKPVVDGATSTATEAGPQNRPYLNWFKSYGIQLAEGVVTGGSLAFLYGLNRETAPAKLDPLQALGWYQGLAILNLETQVNALAAEAFPAFEAARAKLPKTKTVNGDTRFYSDAEKSYLQLQETYFAKVGDLRKQYEHLFNSSPKMFRGKAPARYLFNNYAKEKGQASRLLALSPELKSVFGTLQSKIATEAKKQNISPVSDLQISLEPISKQLEILLPMVIEEI